MARPAASPTGKLPTDDWIFKGTVDSNAVNISPSAGIGAYQLTKLTLTQASLGLFDIGITNAPVLFFYPEARFGFAFNVYTNTPWTVIVYESNLFMSAHTLDEYLALITTPLVNPLRTPASGRNGMALRWKTDNAFTAGATASAHRRYPPSLYPNRPASLSCS